MVAPPAPRTSVVSDAGVISPSSLAGESLRSLTQIETELATLQRGLAESWDRLNRWQTRLVADATALNKHEHDLAAREADVDAKDAELRGQLHDLTRFQEQMSARERELSDQLIQLQQREDALKQTEQAAALKDAEVAKRNEELARREHVFAQRWSRLLSAKCPHCGKPVSSVEQSTVPA